MKQDEKYKERNRQKCKEHYQNNREQRLAKGYEYYIEHRDEILKKRREYNKTHREERKRWLNSEVGRASEKASKHKRRALILKNGGSFTKDEVVSALLFFDYMCPYTGEPLEDSYHLDHIVALSKGGTNYIWNIVPCNSYANLSKHNSDMEEWFRKQPYFSEERLQKIYAWMDMQKNFKLQDAYDNKNG